MRKGHQATFFGLGLLFIGFLSVVQAQQVSGLAEVATGDGILTSDSGDCLRINAVAVFLRENGEAEICLMTPKKNVYAGGRWLHDSDTNRMIGLEITDDTEGGCLSGRGTLFLQDGCVPVARLNVSVSRLDGTSFEAEFFSRSSRPCLNP